MNILEMFCHHCMENTIWECQSIYNEDGTGPDEPSGGAKCLKCGNGGLF